MMGQVQQLFIRPRSRAAMQSCRCVTVQAGRGILEEKRRSKKRNVSFISVESWHEVLEELGADLPIETRRANVVVRGMDLAILVGKHIRIGQAVFKIHGETDPCLRMNAAYPGLMEVLLPYCRGGVFGQVLIGGEICVGDEIYSLES